jgi:hypothetical protein
MAPNPRALRSEKRREVARGIAGKRLGPLHVGAGKIKVIRESRRDPFVSDGVCVEPVV